MWVRAFFLTLLWLPAGLFAQSVSLSGAIDRYAIEMELARGEGGGVQGRYRYAGKARWLSLKGQGYGRSVIALEESIDGAVTGQFFLDVGTGWLSGRWVAGERDLSAELQVTEGALAALWADPPREAVTASVQGSYFVGYHWINEIWAPNYEIGFNGGPAYVTQLEDDLIEVGFEFIVGPTYHFASFMGQARRIGEGRYEHKALLEGSDEPCHLIFQFRGTELQITQESYGFGCQFGARAHANFTLQKESDEVGSIEMR